MPINIYNAKTIENIDYLCDDIWQLPIQIDELEKWLSQNHNSLPTATYVADIGFDIRKDANGGGAVLSSNAMKLMGDIGMDIYFSEYPDTET